MTTLAPASVAELVADVPGATRAVLAGLWGNRARSEGAVRVVFGKLADDLAATGAHPEVVALARRATLDEERHAASCQALALAYGAAAPAEPPTAVQLPEYVAEPRLRVALQTVNHCCIGETIAVAFIAACVDECAGPALREIHRQHLADEIHHARVGWAHVATLSAPERAAVARWMPELLRGQLAAWESRIAELPAAGVPGHAYPPRDQLLATVHAAVTELVIPGLAHVGIDAGAAAEWFAARPAPVTP